MMYLRLIKYLFMYLLVSLPMDLLGMLILPFVLPFIPKGRETLPSLFKMWDNYSGRMNPYPIGDGLSGDMVYRAERVAGGHTFLFWERYYWLALRNPSNYFQNAILGREFGPDPYTFKIEYYNQRYDYPQPQVDRVGDAGTVSSSGFRKALILLDGEELYEYYYISRPYHLFSKTLCIDAHWGWKLLGPQFWILGFTPQWVFNFNPFKPYTGAQ